MKSHHRSLSCLQWKYAIALSSICLALIPSLRTTAIAAPLLIAQEPSESQPQALPTTDEELSPVDQLNQQVGALYEQGQYDEAIRLAEQVLTTLEQQLGQDHPDVVAGFYYLARLYQSQGRSEEAETLLKRALTIREQQLGENHPGIVTDLYYLASFYQFRGHPEEAETLLKRAFAIQEQSFEPGHPHVETSLNSLVSFYQSQGRYDEAIALVERALTVREQQLGENHPAVAHSLNILASFYQFQGRYGEAETLLQRVLNIREQLLEPNHPDVEMSLNSLVSFYQLQRRYDEAEALLRRAIAIREQQLGENHPAIATNLSSLAGIYQSQERYREAEPLLQRALTIQEQQLEPGHPTIEANLNSLVSLYQFQERYGEAEALLQRALTIQEQQLGESHPAVVSSLNRLASFYQYQRRYEEAEPLLQRVLAIREQQLELGHSELELALSALVTLYQYQRSYGEAEALLQQVLTTRKQQLGESHPAVVNSLNSLAGFYQSQGRYREAETLLQRALMLQEQQLGESHPAVVHSLDNLARLYQAQGRYGEAETLLKRVITIQELLGPNNPAIANGLNNLAEFYQSQRRYGEAETLLKRVITIQELLGPNNPAVTHSLDRLAKFYQAQGRYEEAEPVLKRIVAIQEQQFGPNYPYLFIGLNDLASLYYAQGRYEEAEPILKRSLTLQEQQVGKDNPQLALNLLGLGNLYREQGRYEEAEPLLQRAVTIQERYEAENHPFMAMGLGSLAALYQEQGETDQALTWLQRALAIEESNLNLYLAGPEESSHYYIATLSGSLNWLLSLHLQSADANREAARLAFTTVLRRKGRVLESVTDSRQRLRQHLSSEDAALLDEYADMQSQLAALLYQDREDQSPEDYQAQVAALRQSITRMEYDLALRSAEFRVETAPVEISAVQAVIPADAALVELVQYSPYDATSNLNPSRRWGSPRYAAYVLHASGDLKWVDLGDAKTIDDAAVAFLHAIRGPRARDRAQARITARTLDELVMQSIRPLLGNATHLLLAPDGQLNLVPFAALIDEHDRYLVETYTITHLTTGRDLLRFQNRSSSQQPPVILANPDFNTATHLDTTVVASANRGPSQRSSDIADLSFGPLPGTEIELRTIAPLLDNPIVLTAAGATETALKQVQSPSILHIATHGFFLEDVEFMPAAQRAGGNHALTDLASSSVEGPSFQCDCPVNNENPLLRSGLALAGFNARDGGNNNDGVLTALEVTGMDLRGTRLVVMSACETGVGQVTNGEGVYGLRRAFVIAGAESQIMSLWKVDDEGTAELMQRYYKQLLSGEERSQALRQVQLELLQNPIYQNPYYWASFVFSGNWSRMEDL